MKWIISNHKNVFDINNIDNYINTLNHLQLSNVSLVICPESKNLFYFKNQNFLLGSQDIKNINDLKDGLVRYAIVGHSYRRSKYNETDEEINNKVKLLINNHICPILCVGEEKGEDYKNVLNKQLEIGLKDVKGNVIIAYEPVWAISSGIIPSSDRLIEVINFIKSIVDNFDINVTFLYGGSVNEETVLELECIDCIDGYLIGAISTDINKFIKIINVVEGI